MCDARIDTETLSELKLNDETYKLLRQIAQDIRQPALGMGRSIFALEGVGKAVGFLITEVHLQGDVNLGQRADYAAVLRNVADALERK